LYRQVIRLAVFFGSRTVITVFKWVRFPVKSFLWRGRAGIQIGSGVAVGDNLAFGCTLSGGFFGVMQIGGYLFFARWHGTVLYQRNWQP
jgi:hypothetical protein